MSDQDPPKANERDSDSDEDRDSDAEIESEPAAAAKKVAAKPRAGAKGHAAAAQAPAGPGASGSRIGVLVLLALLAGGAGGWFGHIQQAKAAALKADSAAPSGSGAAAGPCGAWEKKICSSTGDISAACMQAKGATELLTPSTCELALNNLPATLSKLKTARASCEKLVSKLCNDLPPGAQTCSMVKEKTPAFPTQRCDEMLKHYDDVIGQLKQMEAQQGGMMGGPGAPGGAHGPGMSAPPGMPPH